MRIKLFVPFWGVHFLEQNFSTFYSLNLLFNHSIKISEDKKSYSYYKTKTFYQNPEFSRINFYYNKTIPRNRHSYLSEKGVERRDDNLQIKTQKVIDKHLKERSLERALKIKLKRRK